VAIGGSNLISNAGRNNQVVMGTYNADTNALLVVGNGTSNTSRSNILEVASNQVSVNGTLSVDGNVTATGFSAPEAVLESNQGIQNSVADVATAPITSPFTMIRPTGAIQQYTALSAVRLLSAFEGTQLVGGSYLPGFRQTIVNYLGTTALHFRKNIVIQPPVAYGATVAYYYMRGGNLVNSSTAGLITLSSGYRMELIINTDEVGDGAYYVTCMQPVTA
jgi:hypothetical protein